MYPKKNHIYLSKSWNCILSLLKKSGMQLWNEEINFSSMYFVWLEKRWKKIYSQGGDGRSNFRYKSHLSQKKQKSYKSYLLNISKKISILENMQILSLKKITNPNSIKQTNSIWKRYTNQKIIKQRNKFFFMKRDIYLRRIKKFDLSQNNEKLIPKFFPDGFEIV